MKRNLLFLLAILSLWGCKKENQPPEDIDIVYGKNRFTTMVDGTEREYYVHVPQLYKGNVSVPVVFMLHGTSGDGLRFYNISGWKEVGEEENILTVFPSSGKYCIKEDDGTIKHTTKWNAFPSNWDFCDGETPLDDIKFLHQIIDELKERYNIDTKRLYVVGFSNGGQMAYRCAFEMSDVFAAVVESAGKGSPVGTPLRNIPITYQFGNIDRKLFPDPNTIIPLAKLDSLLQHSPRFMDMASDHTGPFQYSNDYTLSGNTQTTMTATYRSIPAGENREFRLSLIHGLGHHYPNGTNHPLEGARENWEWMKQYALP